MPGFRSMSPYLHLEYNHGIELKPFIHTLNTTTKKCTKLILHKINIECGPPLSSWASMAI